MKDHGEGLQEDLEKMVVSLDRRRALGLLVGAGLVPFLGCGGAAATTGSSGGGSTTATTGSSGGGSTGSCANVPEETAGPFPGDGSNGANALATSGVVRSDIRTSFGGMSGTAAGIPLTIEITLVNAGAGCAALSGYAIYVWQCDRDAQYSLYTLADQNYLRGVQETDGSGKVTFTSIFPACYPGRWPHIHFEIFPSLAKATAAGNKVKTSQIALPEAACKEVFATAGYASSVTSFAQISLSSDTVFADGSTLELASATGDATSGYTAKLTVGIAA